MHISTKTPLLQKIDYEKIENAFIDLVEDCGFSSFPVDFFDLARRLDVELVEYSSLSQKDWEQFECKYRDGLSLIHGGQYQILYNDCILPKGRMRFTLWYELGHIALHHFDDEFKSAERQAAECRHFAKFALAPMPFVLMAEPESPADIMEIFGTSEECSFYIYDDYLNVLQRYPGTAKRIRTGRIASVLDFDIEGIRLNILLGLHKIYGDEEENTCL